MKAKELAIEKMVKENEEDMKKLKELDEDAYKLLELELKELEVAMEVLRKRLAKFNEEWLVSMEKVGVTEGQLTAVDQMEAALNMVVREYSSVVGCEMHIEVERL